MKSKLLILLTMLLTCIVQVKADASADVITKEVGTNSGSNSTSVLYPYDKNSGSQTLYLSSEIGQPGLISEISFYVASYSAKSLTGRVKIYMAETTKTTLSATDQDHVASKSNMTLVYDSGEGKYTGPQSIGWESFKLTEPFQYNGKNLVVATEVTKSSYNTSLSYAYSSLKERSIIRHSDDNPVQSGNAFDENTTTSNGTTYAFSKQNVPYTKFSFSSIYETSGTGTYGNVQFGLSSWFSKMATQSLYLASEVGRAGCITKLSYQYCNTDVETLNSVQVYMLETCQGTLTTSNLFSSGDMTRVYNGNITLGGSGVKVDDWVEITLDNPFHYSGTGNLVIAISRTGTGSKNYFYGTQTSDVRTWTTTSYTEPGKATSSWTGTPNVRLSFAIHDCGTTYSANGFGICKNCQKELLYEFKKPTDITGSSDYRISNVGELMWFSRAVNKGQAGTSYWGYLSNDIDLTGYNWIPIGNDTNPMKCRLYGYDRNTTVGHTISGIPSTSSLLGTFSGVLYSLRLTSGALVNKGSNGTIYSCLTLGSALVKSGTASINNSYYLSTSTADAARGARTAAQMKSGQVTYELSQSSNSKWYQTLGTDDYPMVSGTDKVYRYTQCPSTTMYTNKSELSGTVQGHNWLNTVCSNCNEEPTTISQDMTLVDNKPYLRKKSATISSGHKVTYSRNFNSMSNWYPLYLPFAVQYNSTLAQNVEIAELSAYGVKDDTNNDGNINSQDQRKLTMSLLKVGDTTEPNKPYLVRAKKTGTISFPSYGATLAKNDENSQVLSTMKETFVATGCYSSKTVTPAKSNGKMLNSNGTSFNGVSSSASCSQFRWTGEISNNNGTAWDQSLLPIVFTDCAYPEFAIVDNETSSYKRATEVTVKNFSYSRIFADRQIGNWQSLYLPFDLTVTSDMLEDVEIARLDDVTTKAGVDYFVVTKLESGQTLEANTLAVIRIKDSALDEDHYWNLSFDQVTLKPAANTKKVFETDQAKYTFTGVYEPYSNATSTWYAIAKSDGLLHEAASGAELPAYRFYMTIDGGTTSAAEIRIGFLENDPFATGIREVEEDDNQTGVYTLDGRRVQSESVQPGIYVKNGKKIWVK